MLRCMTRRSTSQRREPSAPRNGATGASAGVDNSASGSRASKTSSGADSPRPKQVRNTAELLRRQTTLPPQGPGKGHTISWHQADTHNRSPSPRFPTLHHSRCAPPPHPTSSFACSASPACDLFTLVPVLSLQPKLKRPLWDLEIAGPPGEHLPYWDQISYTRFLFDSW